MDSRRIKKITGKSNLKENMIVALQYNKHVHVRFPKTSLVYSTLTV